MRKRPVIASFVPVSLDPESRQPLHHQLYEEIRVAILRGRLASGTRMPASRDLADSAKLSRNTVLTAFGQLIAEGYLVARAGSGTYVTETLPELPGDAAVPGPVIPERDATRALSRFGQSLLDDPLQWGERIVRGEAFRPGLPALERFPFDTFRRLIDRRLRHPAARMFTYGNPQGWPPLREAIAQHLAAARGAHLHPDQIVIVSGAQQAIDMVARVVLDAGDRVWFEDPGYFVARRTIEAVGAEVVPIPVDDDGLRVDVGEALAPEARLAYVTPSHQHPMGTTMTVARRLQLLEWASRRGAWILEDDFASEYRYTGRPLAALQGLDERQRVIYVGTFSKTLFASLRLGYLVAPPDLVPALVQARELCDRQSPTLLQAVVADFLEQGHFARHLRRMRTLYSARQERLLEAARAPLDGLLELRATSAGMNLLGWLPQGVDDRAAAAAARAAGITAPPLSSYSLRPVARGGLVLGYTGVDPERVPSALQSLASVLRPIVSAAR